MADESDLEKTEPPSERKLEKAREEGNVPRSKDLATFLVLIVAGAGLWWTGGVAVDRLRKLLMATLSFDRTNLYDLSAMYATNKGLLGDVLLAFAPVALLILVVAAASPILIGGWNFTTKALAPKFSKLNPITGLGNLISKNSLVELVKAIAKTLIVGLVAYIVISRQFPEMLAMSSESLPEGAAHLSHLLWLSFFVITGALGLIAAFDAVYQVKHYLDQMKMTQQEVRQEAKEAEGDPQIKARIRQQQREMARRRMMSDVPTADVVVVNPTHYSVALKYTPDGTRAPLVVAKGSDVIAARIREIAAENGVPILSAPPLARALHQHTEIGDEIPQTLYSAVAQVLAYVFQLKDYRTNGGKPPVEPTALEVPPGMDPLTKSTSK